MTSKLWERSSTTVAPSSSARKPSMAAGGSLERLARVRLRTLPSSRKDSRRRMQGLELRLGTTSMYMGTHSTRRFVGMQDLLTQQVADLHGYIVDGSSWPISLRMRALAGERATIRKELRASYWRSLYPLMGDP